MRNDYEWNEIEAIVRDALTRVVREDADLFRFEVHERAFTHRLAVYLEQAFEGWHVDCEYNRQDGERDNPKILNIEGVERRAFPDVIVHRRGPWDAQLRNNLLAVEVKPPWADEKEVAKDLRKLPRYLADHHYQFAVFVTYELNGTFTLQRVV
jgi:hypothetical protein